MVITHQTFKPNHICCRKFLKYLLIPTTIMSSVCNLELSCKKYHKYTAEQAMCDTTFESILSHFSALYMFTVSWSDKIFKYHTINSVIKQEKVKQSMCVNIYHLQCGNLNIHCAYSCLLVSVQMFIHRCKKVDISHAGEISVQQIISKQAYWMRKNYLGHLVLF
jgi:hypothetical protein